MKRRVLVFSSTFPSASQPIHGVFVKERVRHVAALPGYEVRVVSPVPRFPPIRWFKRWYPLSQIPQHETIDGLEVLRPRYVLLPKVGACLHGASMARGARAAVKNLAREFPFDLIDAHFVFPDGVAAMKLARQFHRPLVITARGEDILSFPRLRVVGDQIRCALREATRLIAVSGPIAEAMAEQGADPQKITVIPNGVDTEVFRPLNRVDVRRQLGLPADRPIVLSVGYRLERKGFHLLVEAIPAIKKIVPEVLVVIVGGAARWGQDCTDLIERQIQRSGVAEHVRLVGPRPPRELPLWYSAADVFALLTSREGCPNALLEALACGLPAVATPIGEIPRVLGDPRLGIVLPDRSAATGAAGILEALSRTWDRQHIRQVMEGLSWHRAAQQIEAVFDLAVSDFRACS